ASILDLHSRRMVGFALGAHHDTALAKAALCMAIAVRGGIVTGVIFHSDQGGEGEFSRSSQHLDHGGVRWAGTRSWSGCPKGRGARACGRSAAASDAMRGRSRAS